MITLKQNLSILLYEKEKILKETGRELMCRIAALLPEKSHGVFKGDKKIKYYKKENGDINLI